MPKLIPLYGGALKANCVGRFVRSGIQFDVIKPGYDVQGRRRQSWTQFVNDGVPVFEIKKRATLPEAQKHFDATWAEHIGDDDELARKAVSAAREARLTRFRNGVTGNSPAPAVSRDGREIGPHYAA